MDNLIQMERRHCAKKKKKKNVEKDCFMTYE